MTIRCLVAGLLVLAGLVAAACTSPAAGPAGPPGSPGPPPSPTVAGGPAVNTWYGAALKEGEVHVYADLAPRETEELARVFARRYPDVRVVWTRGRDRDLLERARAQGDDGSARFDVFVGDAGVTLKGSRLAASWSPPEARALRSEYADPDGVWYATAVTYHVLQYHIEQVPPASRPRGYEELADPRYLGRLAAEEGAYTWLKGLIESRGRQPTIEVLGGLAQQGVVLQRGSYALSNLVGAGRHAVAISNALHAVELDRRTGAKTGWVAIEPVVVQPTAIVVGVYAPHPNAAQLFGNFLLSADAQVALAEGGRIPTRHDVDPEPAGLVRSLRVHATLPPQGAEEAELRTLYADLWRR